MRIMLLGSTGQLGTELARQLSSIAHVTSFPREALDITNHKRIADTVRRVQPDIIVNAAAYTAVDKAETDADFAYAVNADAVAKLAQVARESEIWLIHYSTDYVFDGTKKSPYVETDTPNPINVYGASKLAGETAIVVADCQHLIFRTSWVISKDGHNFAKTILRLASQRDSVNVIDDQIGVPTSPSLITRVTLDAIRAIKNKKAWPKGVYHLVPKGKTSWHEIAKTLIVHADKQDFPLFTHIPSIKAITTAEFPTMARRPLNSQLDTNKLRSKLSFEIPFWKDDFLAVADQICKGLITK